MLNNKSCCIIFPEEFKLTDKLRYKLMALLENLIVNENVTEIYFYNMFDCEKKVLDNLTKIQLVYPNLNFINTYDKSKFKLPKHKSPIFNDDAFLEFEEICLEHFLSYSYKILKYCQMVSKCDYAIFIKFEKVNNPFLEAFRFAENNENCKIFELK